MASLCRSEVAGFTLAQAHTLDELEQMPAAERTALLIPTEQLFAELPAVCLGEFHEKLIRSGCAVAERKLKVDLPAGTRVRLSGKDGFFALGEAVISDGAETAIRAIKTFQI